MQGKLESAMVRQKELANMAKAAGDDVLRREAQGNINLLTSKYNDLCKASGLPTRAERMNVSGFRKVKAIDKSSESGIIMSNKVIEVPDVQYVGKINREILEKEFGKIHSDEVVLTNERIQHIKEHHLNDYDMFDENKTSIINEPDLILKDEKNDNTIFMIKHIDETNMNVIVKLAVIEDEKHTKNSIMTAYRMRDRNVKKLKEKNKTLYKKE